MIAISDASLRELSDDHLQFLIDDYKDYTPTNLASYDGHMIGKYFALIEEKGRRKWHHIRETFEMDQRKRTLECLKCGAVVYDQRGAARHYFECSRVTIFDEYTVSK